MIEKKVIPRFQNCMEWVWKKDLLWCVGRSVGTFAIRRPYIRHFLHMDFTDVGMQLSHCIHMMIIFRWNSSSKQEWTWEPFLVFVMSGINLYCWAIRAFLPSAGSVAFITSIMILSARPMLHRTFPVQDLIENATTDFAHQNLYRMRYCYSADVFRIHPTNPDDVVCFTLRQQPWFQCRLWCNIFLCFQLFLSSLPLECSTSIYPLRQKAF